MKLGIDIGSVTAKVVVIDGAHDIIDPRDTRKFLAQALDMLRGSRDKVISEHLLQNWPVGF